MPRGPKGEKRPADVIGNAVHIMRIAAGEIKDLSEDRQREIREPHAHGCAVHSLVQLRETEQEPEGTVAAMAARISNTLWSMTDLAEMVDAPLLKGGSRGPYKKKLDEI